MKKIIFSLCFLVFTICCVRVATSFAEVEKVPQGTKSFRTILDEPRTSIFVFPDAYKDKSPVNKESLKKVFLTLTQLWGGTKVRWSEVYSVFKETKGTWVGDTSVAVTAVQSLYKNGKVIEVFKTTYLVSVEFTHDVSRSVYKMRCTLNDIAVVEAAKEPKKVYKQYERVFLWPPSAKEQDDRILSLFRSEYNSGYGRLVKYKKTEKYHSEIVTSLNKVYIQQMLRQNVPAKRSKLRVVEDGVFWGETPLVTITAENGKNKITADFDLHYIVSCERNRLVREDVVPYRYLRETFGRSLVRCTLDEVQLQRIPKKTIEEVLKNMRRYF